MDAGLQVKYVDPKEGRLAVDLDPQKEVILFRTFEWQGLEDRFL